MEIANAFDFPERTVELARKDEVPERCLSYRERNARSFPLCSSDPHQLLALLAHQSTSR